MAEHRKWEVIRHQKDRDHAVPCQVIGCGRPTFRRDALCDYHGEES